MAVLGYVAPLWLTGIICLIWAAVGDTLEISGVKVPAISSKRVRAVIGGIGVVALLLGLILFLAPSASPSPQPPVAAPSPPVTPVNSPPVRISPVPTSPESSPPPPFSAQASSPAAPSFSPTAAPVAIQWQGTLTLDDGWADGTPVTGCSLDYNPPTCASIGDIELNCNLECTPGDIADDHGIAAWNGTRVPDARQCAQLLNSDPSQYTLAVQPGTRACSETVGGRFAYLQVTGVTQDQIRLDVAVWALS